MLDLLMWLGKSSMMIDLMRYKLTLQCHAGHRTDNVFSFHPQTATAPSSSLILASSELFTLPNNITANCRQSPSPTTMGFPPPSHHHLLIATLSIRHIPNRALPPQVTVPQSVMWQDKAQHREWQGVIEKVQQPVAWLVPVGQSLRLYCQFPMLEVVPKRPQVRRAQ